MLGLRILFGSKSVRVEYPFLERECFFRVEYPICGCCVSY